MWKSVRLSTLCARFWTHLWQLLVELNAWVVTCRYSDQVEMARTAAVQPTSGGVQGYASSCHTNIIQLGMLEDME